MNDEWKDLYKKPQEHDVQHTGPLLFYTELVIDHFTNPRNVGELENPVLIIDLIHTASLRLEIDMSVTCRNQ